MLCLTAEQTRAVLLQGGILSIDIDPTDPGVVATAGMDHNVHIFSRQVLALLPAADCLRHLLLSATVIFSHTMQSGLAVDICALCDRRPWGWRRLLCCLPLRPSFVSPLTCLLHLHILL